MWVEVFNLLDRRNTTRQAAPADDELLINGERRRVKVGLVVEW